MRAVQDGEFQMTLYPLVTAHLWRKAAVIGGIPLLLLTACAGKPVVIASASGCSSLIPTSWEQGVAPPDLPADQSVGSWVSFGDAAIGKLDQANGRTGDAIEIQRRCEARDAAAIKRGSRGFFGRLFS